MVTFPNSISVGETLRASVKDCGFTSMTGYIVGPARHEITFAFANNRWEGMQDTEGWGAGRYKFELWAVCSDTTRKRVVEGSIQVQASLLTEQGGAEFSTLTPNEQIVANITAMIAGNASQGVKRYKINNRELERYSVTELLELLKFYKREVAKEKRPGQLGGGIKFYL